MFKRIKNFFSSKKTTTLEQEVVVLSLPTEIKDSVGVVEEVEIDTSPAFEKYSPPANPGKCNIEWEDFKTVLTKDQVYQYDATGYLIAASEDSFFFVDQETPTNPVQVPSEEVDINKWLQLPAHNPKVRLDNMITTFRALEKETPIQQEPILINPVKTGI
jgi:hypothetical protein